jgi:L-lactate utilization protein LutC
VSLINGPSSTSDLAAMHVVGGHGPGEAFVWVIAEE